MIVVCASQVICSLHCLQRKRTCAIQKAVTFELEALRHVAVQLLDVGRLFSKLLTKPQETGPFLNMSMHYALLQLMCTEKCKCV
jgi:hypothetical protein